MFDLSRNRLGVAVDGPECPHRALANSVAYSVKPLRTLLPVLVALILFCGAAHGAGALDNTNASASPRPGFVKLPVIDKQDIRFIPLFVDGKSVQARIWSIAQDNFGFLWLGTSDGLYRYDGYSLKRYRNGRDPLNSLSSDPFRIRSEESR